MKKDINVQLIDELMGCITQTDVWSDISWSDPAILQARARFEKALERIEGLIPREHYVELADAAAGELSATGDAGILYGMHIVFAMQDVASRPSDLSRHVLDRMGGVKHE